MPSTLEVHAKRLANVILAYLEEGRLQDESLDEVLSRIAREALGENYDYHNLLELEVKAAEYVVSAVLNNLLSSLPREAQEELRDLLEKTVKAIDVERQLEEIRRLEVQVKNAKKDLLVLLRYYVYLIMEARSEKIEIPEDFLKSIAKLKVLITMSSASFNKEHVT